MKRVHLFLVPVFLLLFGAVLLAGCGSDGDSAPPCAAPTVDVNGTWTVTGTDNCADPASGSSTFSVYLVQNGNSVTDSTGGSGSVCGNVVTLSDSYPEDNGTTTETITLTVTSGTPMTFSGTGAWTWTNGTSSCSGSDTYTGSKY